MKKKEYRTPYCISIHIDPREIMTGSIDLLDESEGEDASTRQQSLWTNWED